MKTTDETIKKETGLRIQISRKQAGMTASELQFATGIGLSTLQNYEAGLRHPPISAIKKIAQVLKVSPAYIACLSEKACIDEPFTPTSESDLIAIQNDVASAQGATILLAFNKFLFKKHDINPDNLTVIENTDPLISPTIKLRSQVIVDKSIRNILQEGIYALEDINGQIIMRHCRQVSGDNTIMLSTEIEAKHHTEFISRDDFGRYRVIGRVICIINWS